MRKRVLIYAGCIFLIFILQSNLVEYIQIRGVKPNLLLIFAVSVALLRGNVEGAVIGFITGLLQDMAFGKVLGFYALLGLYLGLIIGSVNKRLYRENFLVVTFFTLITTVAYEFLVCLLRVVLTANANLVYSIVNLILPEAVYNSLFSIPIYILAIKIHQTFEEIEKVNRKY